MSDFESLLDTTGEVGYVDQIMHPLIYVKGLPGVTPNELVRSESGKIGQVLSLSEDYAEVVMFSSSEVSVEERMARTKEKVSMPVGNELLGLTIDPSGRRYGTDDVVSTAEKRQVHTEAPPIMSRKNISDPLETGVSLVDVIVPIGKGQRELVLGDRRIGKVDFLRQAFLSHAKRGGVCIWAAVGKRVTDILALEDFVKEKGIEGNSVIVATSSIDSSGLVYLTPYSAMTVAEYFRDQGMDVLVVFDDLTMHAKYYREVTLLAKRFPGRSAYPGDIFYAHAKLMERAGQFQKGSITALPVAETVFSDISGYIQTNLMSMTDGHIFFDQEMYNQGNRPAINPFLSVTRVGKQTQTPMFKTLSTELTRFLVELEKVKELLHFGGEIGKEAKAMLSKGELVSKHFNQGGEQIMPIAINAFLLAGIWAGFWQNDLVAFEEYSQKLLTEYEPNVQLRRTIDTMVGTAKSFDELIDKVKNSAKQGEGDGEHKGT